MRAPRDPEKLVRDVADMRRRIAEENPRPSPWDLKNRRGGLIDIEFIVQYLMLRYAASAPEHPAPRHGAGTRGARRGRSTAGARRSANWRTPRTLLRNVQAVLTLLGDGAPAAPLLGRSGCRYPRAVRGRR